MAAPSVITIHLLDFPLEYYLSLSVSLFYSRWIRLELPALSAVAFRFAMVIEKTAVERGRKRERRSGKARVIDQTAGMTERASTPFSICLSDPQGRDEAIAREGAQNSVKKGVYFGTYRSRVSMHASHEALTLAHPDSPCSRGASV
jgi:hypothetical protein